MSKYKRICIIGNWRCGSQYIAKLIENSFLLSTGMSYYNMGEPFTDNQSCITVLDNHNYIQLDTSKSIKFIHHYNRMTRVLSSIENAVKNQSLVMRLFPNYYTIPNLDLILNTLSNCGFDFIINKRNNVEDHLLSMAIASTTDKWVSYNGSGVLNKSITVGPHGFEQTYDLYKSLKVFDSFLEMFNLHNNPTVYYETALENLSEILQITIHDNVDHDKQMPLNPYEFIINAKEVKQFVEKLANDIRKEK